MKSIKSLNPSLQSLLEIGLMFLPAIPAYLWAWPNLEGVGLDVFQTLVYLYVIAGTVWIGRRRWSWEQLGVNRQGLWLALGCTLALLAARLLIILGIEWDIHPVSLTGWGLAGRLLFYFGLVGVGEELLFRGLVYRLLEDWPGARHGTRLAIWGSSFGFMLWHIFGQGPLVGFATLLIGLLFALIRWRAGGIVGLIVLHGLWDLQSVLLVAESNAEIIDGLEVTFSNPAMVWLGTALLVLVPVYVWLLHPRLARWFVQHSIGA